MVPQERTTWAGLIVTLLATVGYVIALAVSSGGGPLTETPWWAAMLGAIASAIVGTTVVAVVWRGVARRRDPDSDEPADIRDHEIAQMGDRVGQAFLVIAGLAVIALCAVDADSFWIANAMFAGFVASMLIGSAARVIAYRRGLV